MRGDTAETSLTVQQSTWRHVPEDLTPHPISTSKYLRAEFSQWRLLPVHKSSTIDQATLLSGQPIHSSDFNLKTYYWIWDWQELLSVLRFISLPFVLKKHKWERQRGRVKLGLRFKLTAILQSRSKFSMKNCVFLHCTQSKSEEGIL
jgi:hypothetical protein